MWSTLEHVGVGAIFDCKRQLGSFPKLGPGLAIYAVLHFVRSQSIISTVDDPVTADTALMVSIGPRAGSTLR